MKPEVQIYVDVHEGDSGIFDALGARSLGVCQTKSMTTGDVVIIYNGYTVALELKRKNDFDNSLHSGRLHDQIARLYETYDFPVLIIEGWKGEELENHLKKTRTLNRRICLYHTQDLNDTVDLISDIVRDLKQRKLNVIRRKVIVEKSLDSRITFLASLPHVGATKAEELLAMFGSPINALAHVDDWIEISGLNEARLSEIKVLLEEE